MELKDLLLKDIMIMDLKATTKDDVITEMVDQLFNTGIINDKDLFKADILKREEVSTTGIGDSIAIPHAHNLAVNKAAVLFAKSSQGIDYEALDGQPVNLFFMIAAPEGADNLHLQALASLSRLLIDPKLIEALKAAQTPDEIINLFEAAQAKKDAEEKAEQEASVSTNTEKPYLVAVSACTNGIAHTYMAEEALKKAAKKYGVDIKVETNGSEGVKNKLSASEIERAAGVIITADKKVEMNRFDGKKMQNRPVVDGINKADELIENALQGKGNIFHSDGTATEDVSPDKQSLGTQVYRSLMNGISNMLPFVVGGGILMALSFLVESSLGDKSMAFVFLNSLGNFAFQFLIPVLAAYIAESIGDRPALMPGFVGGYMASQATASFVSSKSPAGFLGGLLAGFIAGVTVLFLKKAFKHLPKNLEGLKPMLFYPVLGLLIVGAIMYFAVDPVFAVINSAISNFLTHMGTGNAIVLGALLGGMMSVDMGGPFNKAAYTFAIGAFTTTGNGSLMAAVMVGGMIPPLGIALATTIWPKKFTAQDRQAGISNYILGAAFITEGAIPFAAADPLRVIASSIIGSAIGGGLTQLFKVNIPAPHGGIFVAPLANSPLLYLLAAVVGAIVAGLIYGIWKPALKSPQK